MDRCFCGNSSNVALITDGKRHDVRYMASAQEAHFQQEMDMLRCQFDHSLLSSRCDNLTGCLLFVSLLPGEWQVLCCAHISVAF